MHQSILIIDFGSQYTQLIGRKVREAGVYCEIYPFNHLPENLDIYSGIILSGSPYSVRQSNSPQIDTVKLRKNKPLLGVCYGAQLLAQSNGGNVEKSDTREYGRAILNHFNNSDLFDNIPLESEVWMSHGDTITSIPNNFKQIAKTNDVMNAAFEIEGEKTFAIQFHPEVYHTQYGKQIINNFLYKICGCKGDWTPESFIEETIANLKLTLKNDKVVMGLSGGVDSTVAATLIQKAIGNNLYCIFVDNGLLRKNEFEEVLDAYQSLGLNVKGVDAKSQFYKALDGLVDPEKKRKAIGKIFIEVFDTEAHLIEDVKWLGQGTIYPDVIESVSVKGPAATIKSHHNVGGLPDYMKLKIIEPLKTLFKDEVRNVGKALSIPDTILSRHPFPGPGLAIRILGDINPEKINLLQEVDHIFINGLKSNNLYHQVWQAGAILLPVKSVGVMGDERTYENAVALRAVTSTDGMTADWSRLPYEFMAQISNEIINKVKGINRVVYDISSKPPATIEWE
jgi:GMP synthase (glutamine-hydrolysing)